MIAKQSCRSPCGTGFAGKAHSSSCNYSSCSCMVLAAPTRLPGVARWLADCDYRRTQPPQPLCFFYEFKLLLGHTSGFQASDSPPW